MNLQIRLFYFIAVFSISAIGLFAADGEFTGQFDKTLVPDTETSERVVFKFATNEKIKQLKSADGADVHNSTGWLFNPQTGKYSLRANLIEPDEKDPFIAVDLNGDNIYQDTEQFTFKKDEDNNPYLWNTTIDIPINGGFFTYSPIFVRYFKMVKTSQMTDSDRLLTQSNKVLARGSVDVRGKKILVQYGYQVSDDKISAQDNYLGVDGDEDGEIDMDSLSPEAARSGEKETVVFRIGQMYISTKKLDLAKNQIVLREHQPKDYKRIELKVGGDFPEFAFTDFYGKKRKFSEFRGKYVLIDVWGIWCPACRDEVPFIRTSYTRFQGRNLEILGLNTDETFTIENLQATVEKNQMKWPQARYESVFEFLKSSLRIRSFPSTFLISPEGKILSMSRSDKDELDLRGKDLIETLDKILPKASAAMVQN
jgi:peroxiredoxin